MQFSENSELRVIGKLIFDSNHIESFTIPANVETIKGNSFLKSLNISVSPDNRNLRIFNGNLLLGKSDQDSDIFDTILFALGSLQHVEIPSYIKCIKSYAFYQCRSLRAVTFAEDSELQVIEEYAFALSTIESITIPPHVTVIKKGTFDSCIRLQSVQFAENSELRSIEDAFSYSTVSSISIPPNVDDLKEGCFHNATHLANIIVSPGNSRFRWFDETFLLGSSDRNTDCFDSLVFARADLVTARVPQFIKRIESYCFSSCWRLSEVEFPPNSELKTIGTNNFDPTVRIIGKPKNISYNLPSKMVLRLRADEIE